MSLRIVSGGTTVVTDTTVDGNTPTPQGPSDPSHPHHARGRHGVHGGHHGHPHGHEHSPTKSRAPSRPLGSNRNQALRPRRPASSRQAWAAGQDEGDDSLGLAAEGDGDALTAHATPSSGAADARQDQEQHGQGQDQGEGRGREDRQAPRSARMAATDGQDQPVPDLASRQARTESRRAALARSTATGIGAASPADPRRGGPSPVATQRASQTGPAPEASSTPAAGTAASALERRLSTLAHALAGQPARARRLQALLEIRLSEDASAGRPRKIDLALIRQLLTDPSLQNLMAQPTHMRTQAKDLQNLLRPLQLLQACAPLREPQRRQSIAAIRMLMGIRA